MILTAEGRLRCFSLQTPYKSDVSRLLVGRLKGDCNWRSQTLSNMKTFLIVRQLSDDAEVTRRSMHAVDVLELSALIV